MAWMKVETSVARHRKFVKAGPAPSWLWVCGLAYCQEGLTDGFIPTEALPYLGVKNAAQLAHHLVAAGLWDQADGGWMVHDYLAGNKSADEIRSLKVDRRAAGAVGGRASGEARKLKQVASVVAEAHVEAPVEHTSKHTSNPDQIRSATATATATEGGSAPPLRMAPLHDSHKKHAICGRVCLFAAQFNDFVRRRNHDGAEREVRKWAEGVIDVWTSGQHSADEPGDPFDFWRDRYAETWPAMKAKPVVDQGPAYFKVQSGSPS